MVEAEFGAPIQVSLLKTLMEVLKEVNLITY